MKTRNPGRIGSLHRVVDPDGVERLGHSGPGHPHRHAPTGEAPAGAAEQHAVGAGEGHEVDRAVEQPGDRHQRRMVGHDRVAVTSWAIPVDRSVRSTRSKPWPASMASMSAGSGRYATDRGRYRYAAGSDNSPPITGTTLPK